jgi:hypothetical protein
MEAKDTRVGLACMFACEVAEAFRSAGMQYLLGAASAAPATKTPNDSSRSEDVGAVVGDAKDANDADARASKPSLQLHGGRVSFSLFEGMYYFSPATLIFLAFLTYVFEWDDVTDPEHLAAARRNPAPFLAASCLGFFVNLASLAVIQHAGSMTLKIVSQLKNVVVICAAVVVYDDVVSALELAGYAVAICGFGMYQDAKARAAEFSAAETEARGGEFRSVAGDDAAEEKNAGDGAATRTRDGAARYRPRSGSGVDVS